MAFKPCKRTPDKVQHASVEAALKALRSLRKSKPLGPWIGPYHCRPDQNGCGAWHLGHDKIAMNRAIRNSLRVGTATSRRQRKVRKRK